jgi:hypothetical protein
MTLNIETHLSQLERTDQAALEALRVHTTLFNCFGALRVHLLVLLTSPAAKKRATTWAVVARPPLRDPLHMFSVFISLTSAEVAAHREKLAPNSDKHRNRLFRLTGGSFHIDLKSLAQDYPHTRLAALTMHAKAADQLTHYLELTYVSDLPLPEFIGHGMLSHIYVVTLTGDAPIRAIREFLELADE